MRNEEREYRVQTNPSYVPIDGGASTDTHIFATVVWIFIPTVHGSSIRRYTAAAAVVVVDRLVGTTWRRAPALGVASRRSLSISWRLSFVRCAAAATTAVYGRSAIPGVVAATAAAAITHAIAAVIPTTATARLVAAKAAAASTTSVAATTSGVAIAACVLDADLRRAEI
jgi:hypothetical protein